MPLTWLRDADEALRQARERGKPLLYDFTAAPA